MKRVASTDNSLSCPANAGHPVTAAIPIMQTLRHTSYSVATGSCAFADDDAAVLLAKLEPM
jgi:hypothetical protein